MRSDRKVSDWRFLSAGFDWPNNNPLETPSGDSDRGCVVGMVWYALNLCMYLKNYQYQIWIKRRFRRTVLGGPD